MSLTPETGHAAPDLAVAVQDGRRSSDLSAAALASQAGVDATVVTRIEQGDAVPPSQAVAVLDALGIDPLPLVADGVPRALLPLPVDAVHAALMRRLGDVSGLEPGWRVHPDVGAMAAATGMTRDALDEAAARAEAWRSWWVGPCTNVALVSLAWFLLVAFQGVSAVTFGWVGPIPVSWASYGLLGVAVFARLGDWGTRTRNPHAGRVAEVTREVTRLDALRSTCAFVSRRGVTTFAVRDHETVRHDHPAHAVTSLEVVPVDPRHVTLRLMTQSGPVEVPWILCSRGVLDVVAGWGRETTILEGPQ